jgi:periplasmic protein TonB
MAYADEETGNRRLIAIGIVALLHAAAGYGIAKIGWSGAAQIIEDLKTFDVAPEEKPKEEKPPPPPPKVDIPPPPKITVPPPVVNVPMVSPAPQAPAAPPAPPPPPPAPAPPPLAQPAPKVAAQKAIPKGSPGSWVTNDDYPPSAKRNEEQGTTGFRLEIGTDGRVTNCSVISSSGSSTLDSTACNLLTRRAKFKPAMDSDGNPMSGSYAGRFTWRLTE